MPLNPIQEPTTFYKVDIHSPGVAIGAELAELIDHQLHAALARERMIDLLKRHEIQVLRRAGHSLPKVAELAGVSVRSVQRVELEPGVTHVDDAEPAPRG